MCDPVTRCVPGTLWNNIQQRAQTALQCHALQPIQTRQIFVTDNGVDFLVRIVSSLAQKDSYRKKQWLKPTSTTANPFLPYEPDLFVCEVTPGHLCLLNKFNVINHHVLLVTKAFQHQENLLTEADFAAWLQCFQEFNCLGFYNGGDSAGASQPHKHMQLIPLPLSSGKLEFPILGLFLTEEFQSTYVDGIPIRQYKLPFKHGVTALDGNTMQDPQSAVSYLYDVYKRLLATMGISGIPSNGDMRQSAPYNLLFSKQWMWLVPRSREHYQDISVNALGFAGSLFVRDSKQLDLVRNVGPMAMLSAVGVP